MSLSAPPQRNDRDREEEFKSRGVCGNCCDTVPPGGDSKPTHVEGLQRGKVVCGHYLELSLFPLIVVKLVQMITDHCVWN